MQKNASGITVMLKAWRPCQRHEVHAKGMLVMLNVWGPCKSGGLAKGHEATPKTWWPCQSCEGHAKVVEAMPLALRTCQRR